MGWLFSTRWPTKSAIIQHLTETRSWESAKGLMVTRETLAKCVRGNVLYAAHRGHRSDGVEERYICVYLLGADGDNGWGYKDMDESMGPCEAKCPPKYFDLVGPPPNDYAAAWREKCRAYAEKMSVKPELGEVWHLPNCQPRAVRITSLKPLRANNYLKVPKRLFGECLWKPDWCTSTVIDMVATWMRTHDTSYLGVLADALEEAGCTSQGFLGQLRAESDELLSLVCSAYPMGNAINQRK